LPDLSGEYKEVKALKNIRLKSYSYKTNGYYFVTICCNYRKPYFTEKIKFVVAQFIESSCLINQATTNIKNFGEHK